MDLRRYELATLAAARRLRSTYCALAHGSILLEQFGEPVREIALDHRSAGLDEVDVAVMDLAVRVVDDASSIGEADLQPLRDLGLSDADIMDVVLTAAARCFFSKALDGVDVRADAEVSRAGAGAARRAGGRPPDRRGVRSLRRVLATDHRGVTPLVGSRTSRKPLHSPSGARDGARGGMATVRRGDGPLSDLSYVTDTSPMPGSRFTDALSHADLGTLIEAIDEGFIVQDSALSVIAANASAGAAAGGHAGAPLVHRPDRPAHHGRAAAVGCCTRHRCGGQGCRGRRRPARRPPDLAAGLGVAGGPRRGSDRCRHPVRRCHGRARADRRGASRDRRADRVRDAAAVGDRFDRRLPVCVALSRGRIGRGDLRVDVGRVVSGLGLRVRRRDRVAHRARRRRPRGVRRAGARCAAARHGRRARLPGHDPVRPRPLAARALARAAAGGRLDARRGHRLRHHAAARDGGGDLERAGRGAVGVREARPGARRGRAARRRPTR